MNDVYFSYNLKLKPNFVVMYRTYFKEIRKVHNVMNRNEKKEKKFNRDSQRKMQEYIFWFLAARNQKAFFSGKRFVNCSFTTLTLPSRQIHSDTEIKDLCLNQFFVELRNRYGLKNYIWRQESQQNGNIHFHIIADIFLPCAEIQEIWNRIIEKLGYVSNYKARMRNIYKNGFEYMPGSIHKGIDKKTAYCRYIKAKNNNFENPPSCQVIGLKKINNVINYISKYVSKKENEENTESSSGNCWFASRSVSQNCKSPIIKEGMKEFEELYELLKKIRNKSLDYIDLFFINIRELFKLKNELINNYIFKYLIDLNNVLIT